MAQKLTANLPLDLDLSGNWKIQLAAVDPTSGAAVTGVKVSGVSLLANLTSAAGDDDNPTLTLQPLLFLPLPLDGDAPDGAAA